MPPGKGNLARDLINKGDPQFYLFPEILFSLRDDILTLIENVLLVAFK